MRVFRSAGGRKSWTQSEIFRLIDLYEERPCLWDVFSSDYHNRDVTGKANRDVTGKAKSEMEEQSLPPR